MTDRQTDRQTDVPEFDKRQTNIAKGIAILLLLWHHLFYNSPDYYDRFTSLYRISGELPIECFFSGFCKVCVSVFLILSGYGLYKSWNSYCRELSVNKMPFKNQWIFVKNHLLKLMLNYWFIYLIFVPMGLFFGRAFWQVYDGNVLYGIADVLGLADLFGTPTMNTTWWFMSVIIILYVLFPVIMRIMEWSAETIVVISIILLIFPGSSSIPYIGQYFVWVLPFVSGIYLAMRNGFEMIAKFNSSFFSRIVLCILMIGLFAYLRFTYYQSVEWDTLFALAVILFGYFVLSRIPLICVLLEKLGKQSGAIFMFHTFIFSIYFKNFVYWFRYPPIIFIVFAVLCYFIAIGLEYLKRLVRYERLMMKVLK